MPAELPLSSAQLRSFRRALLRWYDEHRRELPWRRDRDPYRVWVSEIMLQQTRVAAVLDHYARFLRRFPSLQSLAGAREPSVLAVWSGLGYYHRARRLHQAAKIIARERQYNFPQTAEEWSQLPGIGRYTAAAIASIAFAEAIAVVDGNVQRVLQRINGNDLDGEAAWRQAQSLVDRKRPGDFNQALMELGATVCTPRTPQCLLCPVMSFCATRGAEATAIAAPRKRKELLYALARSNDGVLLVQRPTHASLMAGMWELPALSAEQINGDAPLFRLRHSITDTEYRVAVFAVAADGLHDSPVPCRWFTPKQCQRLALTGLTRKILRRLYLASTAGVAVSN